jgi:signal transduction histidine kinase
MNLRRKTILIIAFAICAILITTLATSHFIVLSGFQNIEQKDAKTQLERATNAFEAECIDLDNFVVDFAAWDDTYNFIQNNNTQYIESNIVNQTFDHSELNLMMFVNPTNQIVYSKTYNLINQEADNFLPYLQDFFLQKGLTHFDENKPYQRGLLYYSDVLFAVSSRPILTTEGEGPILGTVIMARQLTPDRISGFEMQAHLDIEVANLVSNNLPSEYREAQKNLPASESFYLKPVNETLMNCYTTANDITGNPSIVFEVIMQRSIYSQGVLTTNIFLVLTAASLIVFGAIIFLNLEMSVLSRITKLKTSVDKVKEIDKLEERGILNDKKFTGKKDELSSLSIAINDMLDRLQDMTSKLRKSQRLAAVGELSVMIAHDLRNPLQSIKFANDCLKNEKFNGPEKKLKMANLIGSDVSYCEKIVNDLLGYSGSLKISTSEVDIKNLVSISLSHVHIPENITVEDLTHNEPKLNLDPEKMLRVFDNLIKNAIEAMPEGGKLKIQNVSSDSRVKITFEDTGKGIEKEHLSKLFTPLFTTKAKGMGFGLAICQRIVEAHEGIISAESSLNHGTTFTIDLPTHLVKNEI